MFAAEFAVFVERELLLHFLLIPLGNDRNLLAFAAPQLCHVFLDDSHIC